MALRAYYCVGSVLVDAASGPPERLYIDGDGWMKRTVASSGETVFDVASDGHRGHGGCMSDVDAREHRDLTEYRVSTGRCHAAVPESYRYAAGTDRRSVHGCGCVGLLENRGEPPVEVVGLGLVVVL